MKGQSFVLGASPRISLVLQDKPTYCFPACFQSYLRDIGIFVSQKEIVERNPVEFKIGSDIEGALKPLELGVVCRNWGLECEEIKGSSFDIHQNEAVLFSLFWLGVESSRHWVRFVGGSRKSGYICFMEPSGQSDYPARVSLSELVGWDFLAFKIKKRA